MFDLCRAFLIETASQLASTNVCKIAQLNEFVNSNFPLLSCNVFPAKFVFFLKNVVFPGRFQILLNQ